MKKLRTFLSSIIILLTVLAPAWGWYPGEWGENNLWDGWLPGRWGQNSPAPSSGYTKLLLHNDGPTFVDSSRYGKTITPSGNAQISAVQSKFGGASGLFDGNGDYLSLNDSAEWVIAEGEDFTIDFWVWFPDNTAKSYAFLSQYVSDTNYWQITMFFSTTNGSLDTHTTENSVVKFAKFWTLGAMTINTWYHVAIVRSSGVMRGYLNGVAKGTPGNIADSNGDFAAPLRIGRRDNTGSNLYFNGYLDELRFSIGIARWTNNFTPPTGPSIAD